MSALPLTRERILQAALEWVDAEGLEALSMRKLAQALGVKAMSLYNYVASKDDILDALVDRVIGEIELPDPALDWKEAMRQRAISAHEVLLRHPWATMPIVSRMNVGPAMLRYVDATLGCLLGAGFSAEMADHVWNAIDSHIYGFTLLELNFPIAATEYVSMAKHFIDWIPPEQYPHLNHLTHLILQGDYDGLHHFEFGLELILNSLEKLRGTALSSAD
ncbi:TetR/AcrR family transcriptional regulator [Synechococcus sp. Nb3U1]|uniref:TetR/AcrR family transcriptional regulator n=1 Tax=Synechococcus sp. Nb3U1 TaxID=1914529 RepID=UPI001F3E6EAB|nr:TetR/AcrR family transcriptional regulator [Synechococcus sp. Nb3U1]MCF2971090.1 TetR/AcrR family transcriptional regulator [Synechococcus sp. Nb3U1]